MSDNDRLTRALSAARPPARDIAFTLAVLEQAEKERFRVETLHALLRGAAIATAAGALVALFADWVWANADAFIEGATISVALGLLLSMTLNTARRVRGR